MNKWGRIVSANKYKTAKKEMRLQKHGFFAEKGKFGAVTRKVRGGKDNKENTLEGGASPKSSGKNNKSPTDKSKGNNKSPIELESKPKPIPASKPNRDEHHNQPMKNIDPIDLSTIKRLKEAKPLVPPAPPLNRHVLDEALKPAGPNIKTDVSNYNKKDR
jgi:hypothetical protein